MANNFPTSLNNYVTGTNSAYLADAGHADEHNKLEQKVGIDGSAVTTSHDYKLSGVAGTDKAVSKTGTETLTNKTLTLPKLNEDVAVTSTATEVNVLDGIPATLTATELGYVDGVTSAIQTQLSTKAPTASPTFTGTVTLPTGLTGIAKMASGVVSAVTAPSGTIVGDTDTQTLSGKTLTSPLLQGTTDGWTLANETWTYASASTITVPSGAASKYAIGDRIKWTQTTVKYGIVVAIADTLLTIAVNTDYVVANAAITLNYYSHEASPVGYPHAFSYTPTLTNVTVGNGTLTFDYCVVGRTIVIYGSFVLGSTSAITGLIGVSIPMAIKSSYAAFVGTILDSGTAFIPGQFFLGTSTRLDIYALNAAGTYLAYADTSSTVPMTWTTNDALGFYITGEIA